MAVMAHCPHARCQNHGADVSRGNVRRSRLRNFLGSRPSCVLRPVWQAAVRKIGAGSGGCTGGRIVRRARVRLLTCCLEHGPLLLVNVRRRGEEDEANSKNSLAGTDVRRGGAAHPALQGRHAHSRSE